MTGANPVDVMIFDMSMLGSLVNENLLKQLDPLLKEDEDRRERIRTSDHRRD